MKRSSLDGWYSRKRWLISRKRNSICHSLLKAIFISQVADDLSLHSSLFSIIYICPRSTKWKLSPLGYYTPEILTNSPQVPTQHRPAKWIKGMCGLCSGSARGNVTVCTSSTAWPWWGGTFKSTVLFYCQSMPNTYLDFTGDLRAFAKLTPEPRQRSYIFATPAFHLNHLHKKICYWNSRYLELSAPFTNSSSSGHFLV